MSIHVFDNRQYALNLVTVMQQKVLTHTDWLALETELKACISHMTRIVAAVSMLIVR